MQRILKLLTVPAIFLCLPATAQEPVANGLRQCAAIVGSVERLACYDQLAQRPSPMTSMGAPHAQPFPATPANQAAAFGVDSMPQAEPAPAPRSSLDEITSTVTDIGFDSRGHFTISLANGQMWKEIEGDTVNVPLRKDRTHTATVSRAILGSYSMHFDNPRGIFKVVRVQ